MTNEEAAKRLEEQLAKETMYWGNYFESEVDKEVAHLAIAALNKVGSPATQLDENGLMPCGCGGKAEYRPVVVCGNFKQRVFCDYCGTQTEPYTELEDVKTIWNRAMGYKEEE